VLPRLDPQFLHKRPSRVLVRLQGIRLALAAVEGEHQLGAEALPVGMLGDQGLELPHQLDVVAEGELGIVQLLEGGQSQILEPRGLAPGEGLVAQVGERRAAPKGQGRLERGDGPPGAISGELAAALGDQSLEAMRVEPLGVEPQHIAVLAGDDHAIRAVAGAGAQRLSQARDVDLQGLGRGRRRTLSPELVDQSIGAERLVGVEQQQR
jgi:hypothetical protein